MRRLKADSQNHVLSGRLSRQNKKLSQVNFLAYYERIFKFKISFHTVVENGLKADNNKRNVVDTYECHNYDTIFIAIC